MINVVPYLLFVALGAISLSIGVYLLRTNPPKDKSKFLGVGAEKLSDEEQAAREG